MTGSAFHSGRFERRSNHVPSHEHFCAETDDPNHPEEASQDAVPSPQTSEPTRARILPNRRTCLPQNKNWSAQLM